MARLHRTHGGHGALSAPAEQEGSPVGAHTIGFMMVYMFSLELMESPALGMMVVPGSPPSPRGPVQMFMVGRPHAISVALGPHTGHTFWRCHPLHRMPLSTQERVHGAREEELGAGEAQGRLTWHPQSVPSAYWEQR